MSVERIEADYIVETAYDVRTAVEVMAGEQSSGTFVPVPGETPELKARSAARVENLEMLGEADQPSLPGSGAPRDGGKRQTARATLSWPLDNIGPSLPNLMATVAGNLFELKQFSGLRVLDIRLPDAFARAYPGPKFGVEGTRELTGVRGRPLIGTIVKPSIGFTPEETADLVDVLCAGGIDFIKDDELQSDGAHCPFEARVRAVMRVINRHAERNGRKVMFAFNLTGEIDEMRRRHDFLESLGGTCVMASLNSVGVVGMIALGRHARLADPCAQERLGLFVAPPCARLVLRRVAENLAPRRRRPHARQWARQQVQRIRRERDSIGPSLSHPDVRRETLHRHAGVFLRSIGPTGGGDTRSARLDRSHFRRGRRHHGAPRWARGRRARAKGSLRGGDGRRSRRTLRRDASFACRSAADGLCMSEPAGLPAGVLVAFYGDDFTGSSAVMEVMTFAGLPAVMFVETPTPEQLERFRSYRAIGIAGVARAQPPSWMDAHLPSAFRALAALKAPVTHYKICSTLDSSSTVGSIGRAIDIGAPIFGETPGAASWQPFIVAAPAIGRYQAFGNLFAASGDGFYRLDRHPVMQRPSGHADERGRRAPACRKANLTRDRSH